MSADSTQIAGGRSLPNPTHDWFSVITDYANEKPSNFLKFFYTLFDAGKNSGLIANDSCLPAVSQGLKEGKLVLAPVTFLTTLNEFREWTYCYLTGEKTAKGEKKEFIDLVRKGLDFVSPVWDTIDLLAKKILSIPIHCMNAMKGIHGSVLAIKMGWDASKSVTVIHENKDTTKVTKALLKIVEQVSLVALGIMIVLTSFYGMVFAPLAWSTFSVASVIFGFAAYAYEKHGTTIKN